MAHPVVLTLIQKPGCHLCTDAEAVLAQVMQELSVSQPQLNLSLQFQNILEDQALAARYADEIPVLLINGAQHSYWHVVPDRLIPAILKEASQ